MRSFARRSASHSAAVGGQSEARGRQRRAGIDEDSRPPDFDVRRHRSHAERLGGERNDLHVGSGAARCSGRRPLRRSAGDHRGVVGGEEHGRARHVLGLVEPAERHRGDVAGAALVVHRRLPMNAGSIGVSVATGAIETTRTPWLAASSARLFAKVTTAPFDAAYACTPGRGLMAAVDAVIRNTPRRCFFMRASRTSRPARRP